MGTRRTGALMLVVLFAALAIVARLYQVQIVEHQLWTDEARRLERTGAVLPYRRGAILDGEGAPIVHDVSSYRLELNYREFRRGHPLGQVAHARAALLQEAVPLQDASSRLATWAAELVSLSPGELYDFARGAQLQRFGFDVPATDAPFADARGARASDVRYYVAGLLAVDRDETRALRRLERRRESRSSYLEYIAELRGVAPEQLLDERRRAWNASLEHLGLLAERLEWEQDGRVAFSRPAAYAALVDDLEQWRRSVEDATATALFLELFDFHPGRVAPELLCSAFELEWLRVQLGWSVARVGQWAQQARFGFLDGWRGTYALPRLIARLQVEGAGAAPDFALSTLLAVHQTTDEFVAALDGRPVPWNEVARVAVLDELEAVVELGRDVPPRGASGLPPLEPATRARLEDGLSWQDLVDWTAPQRARDLERAFAEELGQAWSAPRTSSAPGAYRDRQIYGGRLANIWSDDTHRTQAQRADRARRVALALLDTFEDSFQAALAARVAQLLEHSPGARLRLSKERGDRLAERSRHVLKDYSSRPVDLYDRPDFEIVYLLTRDAQHYPGVRVVPRRERRVAERADGGPLASELVGNVSMLDASGEIRQRAKSQRLAELRRQVTRSPGEERELADLMQELLRRDELRGVSGLERSFDGVLRGANGYRELLGLEDIYGRGARSVYVTEVMDGSEIGLTIVPDLQRAARAIINEPVPPLGDSSIDHGWYREPVGAIVVLDLQGRVLAAASAPDGAANLTGDEEGERARVVERVFGAADFQPIGSVFKPFVALWALDRLEGRGHDANFVNVCEPPDGASWSEYRGLRCWSRWGHGARNLPHALGVSCNPYFAHLGDLLGEAGVMEVALDFGFGLPTGAIETHGLCEVESGFVDWSGRTFQWNRTVDLGLQVRRAANGLQVVEGSPAQVARAYLALATGALPPLRLVDRVGGVEVPWVAPTPLPYDATHLESMRRYLLAVTNWRDGSAFDSLQQRIVGYRVAAKTGSADLESRPGVDGSRVRKHTWIAGWVPAEDPQLVFAIFVHDTSATSSHSAAYVTRDLLLTRAVGDWLLERGHSRDFTAHDIVVAPMAFATEATRRDENGAGDVR